MYHDYYDSESSFSQQNDFYIKKHIEPIQRGGSAIFGDPLSQQKNQIILHSPDISQQEEQQQVRSHSKLNFDQNKSKLEESEKSKQEQGDRSVLMNDQIKVSKSELVEEKPRREQQAHDNISGQIRSEENNPIQASQKDENIEQQKSQPNVKNEEKPFAQDKEEIQIQNGIILNNQSQKSQQSKIDVDKLVANRQQPQKQVKQQRNDPLQLNEDQTSLILQTFKKNTQGIERVYNHIIDQNTILAQFKQDASRKLQQNIKLTLKEKMNQINRQNSKEIKDIKNLVSNVLGLLEKHESRIDRIEKSTEEILKVLKKK